MEYDRGQLNKAEQMVYHAMLTAAENLLPSAAVPLLPGEVLADIWCRLRLDHPEIFWLKDYTYSYAPQADFALLKPTYLFDKGKIRTQQQAVAARTEKLLRPVRDGSEREKLLFIHHFICSCVQYDKLKKPYSHEIFGTLTNGIGVCEGIAKTVQYLCTNLNIPCRTVLCGADREHGEKYRHAWNVICMGGKWYHFDMTFDLTLSKCGTERFDYFALSDEQCFRDHRPSSYPIPRCGDSGQFYYKTVGLSFTKEEDYEKRMRQAVRKNQIFVFHWRGGYLTRQKLADLLVIAEKAAAEKGKAVFASVNFSQATVCLHFDREQSGTAEENAMETELEENQSNSEYGGKQK